MIAVSRGCTHDVAFLGKKTCLMFFTFVCKVSGWQATLPRNMTSLRFSNHILRSSLSPWCLSPFKHFTAQKMKFSIKDFFSKWDQMRSFLRIWSHLLKKSLMECFIFCAVVVVITRCWVQYGKYFPSFSYFVNYFMSLWASEIIAKYEKLEKYLFVRITCSKSYLTY